MSEVSIFGPRPNLTKGLGKDSQDRPPRKSRSDSSSDDQTPPRVSRTAGNVFIPRFMILRGLLWIASWVFSVANIALVHVLRWIDILARPRAAHDAMRITWKCHCGTVLYADYPISDREMVARLSVELNRPALVSPMHTTPSTTASAPPTVSAGIHGAGGSGVFGSGVRQDAWYGGPYGDPPATGPSAPQASNGYIGSQTLVPKYLEVCVNTGKLRQSLCEIDLTRFSGDIELFRWLRRSYAETRGWRTYVHFFLAPKAMRFVYFGIEQREKVHILCKDESYPPPEEILAERYHYTPCPLRPDGSMSMPSDAFIHYLHHCNLDVEVTPVRRIWLDRLPKKMWAPLLNTSTVSGGSTLLEAWGVHIIEGVDRLALLWTFMVILLLTFGALLGAYIIAALDLQSGSSVMSVVLGTIGLILMLINV